MVGTKDIHFDFFGPDIWAEIWIQIWAEIYPHIATENLGLLYTGLF